MTKEERAEMLALMQEAMKPMLETQKAMQSDIVSLKKDVTKIEVTIENQVDRAIKTIGEGHSILNRKLDEKINLEHRVEKVEDRVSAVEYVLKKAE